MCNDDAHVRKHVFFWTYKDFISSWHLDSHVPYMDSNMWCLNVNIYSMYIQVYFQSRGF